MEAFKIAIKLFATQDVFEPSEFVAVFQRWIQTQALADHLLIDVADYAHVVDGPGSVLVTSQANLSTDRAGGKLGLVYFRKLPIDGSFRDRLHKVMADALKAAALLEEEPSLKGRLTFKTNEWLFRLSDRLLSPNTHETFEKIKPELEGLTRKLYGEPASLEHKPSALTLFEVHVKAAQSPPVKTLLQRFV
jgi:hypothetical protein